MEQLVAEVIEGMNSPIPKMGRWLACLNPHSYVMALSRSDFESALLHADWLIPDGAGIVLGSRMLAGNIRERVSGPDAFLAISAAMNQRGAFTAMFIGATQQTLDIISNRYRAEFSQVGNLVTFSPPFRDQFTPEDIGHIRDLIARHQPDVLWMGLTAPKQEVLLYELAQNRDFGFAAAIGAAFDFYAGNVQRSKPIFRRLGLEWLPRLVQQPRRLWRRMFISAPIFLGHVLQEWLRRLVSQTSR